MMMHVPLLQGERSNLPEREPEWQKENIKERQSPLTQFYLQFRPTSILLAPVPILLLLLKLLFKVPPPALEMRLKKAPKCRTLKLT